MEGLGRPGKELMAYTTGTYGWFELYSWFVCLLTAKGSQTMPVLLTVVHKHNIAKEPQKDRNAKKRRLADGTSLPKYRFIYLSLETI